MALEKSMNFQGISILEGDENGLLLPYIIRFFDALGQEVYAEPILIFKTGKKSKVIDPLQIWDYNTLEGNYVSQKVMDFIDSVDTSELTNEISSQVQNLNDFAQHKHEKDLELDLKRLNADFECKIAIEERNIRKAEDKGQRFLIPGHEDNVKSLRAKHQQIISELESSRNVN
jgi:hypothetical protein